jgi:glucose dehydrogenase
MAHIVLARSCHVLWQVKAPQPLVGGTLATAGGLVFTGEPNGEFNAYDAATGATLWSTETGAGSVRRRCPMWSTAASSLR